MLDTIGHTACLRTTVPGLTLLANSTGGTGHLFRRLLGTTPDLSGMRHVANTANRSGSLCIANHNGAVIVNNRSTQTVTMLKRLVTTLLANGRIVLRYPDRTRVYSRTTGVLCSANVDSSILDITGSSRAVALLCVSHLTRITITNGGDRMRTVDRRLTGASNVLARIVTIASVRNVSRVLAPSCLRHFIARQMEAVGAATVNNGTDLLRLNA